ncbi:MAG: AMP-binding protein, partial [Proteobacteria bacterium]|nr:AMP-binding protein [Pseudomonadota bacterium]
MTENKQSPYDHGLDKNPANYVPLTPLTFIQRSAYVYPDRLAVVHGKRRFTWQECYARCRRLASALKQLGVGKNDTVAVVLNNTPEMFECHFGVPACGAVLNTVNTRLDAEAVAFILNHAEAKVLITDREYARVMKKAVELADRPD